MLIPLGSDRPNERKAVVTHAIIAINIGVFVALALLAKTDPELAGRITDAGAISRDHFRIWQPVTSTYLHGGFMHIFGNMIFLLVFAPPVEDRFGRIGFVVFYTLGGAASGLAHIALEHAPAIGASGAVAAVAGAFLVMFPKTHIRAFVFFIFIGIFMIPSWWLIGMFIVLDLFSQVFSSGNGIANLAHLGGYAFGISIALGLIITGLIPRQPYDLFSIAKHRHRRRVIAGAGKRFDQSTARVHTDHPHARPSDPDAEDIAQRRARIGTLLATDQAGEGADAYLAMVKAYGGKPLPLTMNRDAQYQIANTLYQRGEHIAAAEAFTRLLDAYPGDPERHIIAVLIARTRAHDQHDPAGAVEMLEALADRAHDDETTALVERELAAVRAMIPTSTEPSP